MMLQKLDFLKNSEGLFLVDLCLIVLEMLAWIVFVGLEVLRGEGSLDGSIHSSVLFLVFINNLPPLSYFVNFTLLDDGTSNFWSGIDQKYLTQVVQSD